MKKYLLIIFFLVSAKALSQSYIAFPDSNARWTSLTTVFWTPPVYEYQFYISGDTLIDSIPYHKIYGCSFYNNISGYYFAMRQDTSTRQVFFRPGGSPEYLAYDFSLSVGDTFYLDSTSFQVFVVTIVDSILVQGQLRKHMRLEPVYQICMCTCEPEWIEGIGSLYGLLPVQCAELSSTNLICFSQDNQTVYPDTGSCPPCATTSVGLSTPQENQITVSPNPFDSQITITFSKQCSKAATFTIRDLLGKIVFYETGLHPGNLSVKIIDLNFLHAGIYSLEIDMDSNSFSKKIMKE